jgi:hypothetical protein
MICRNGGAENLFGIGMSDCETYTDSRIIAVQYWTIPEQPEKTLAAAASVLDQGLAESWTTTQRGPTAS